MTTLMTDPSPRLIAALTQPPVLNAHGLRGWLSRLFTPKPSIAALRGKPDHLLRDIGLSQADIDWLREAPGDTLIR